MPPRPMSSPTSYRPARIRDPSSTTARPSLSSFVTCVGGRPVTSRGSSHRDRWEKRISGVVGAGTCPAVVDGQDGRRGSFRVAARGRGPEEPIGQGGAEERDQQEE